MEPPPSMSAQDLQAARETVIAGFRPLAADDVVLGQYDGYRETEGIADDSATDTFAAARLWIDTERWRDVPFLLRTGKQLAASEQQVSLIFRAPEGPLRSAAGSRCDILTIKMAGSGQVSLQLLVKQPGEGSELQVATSELLLASLPDADPLPPYVRLIHDVICADRTLFTRPDGLGYAWDTIAPILANRPQLQPYQPGSWGPAAAAGLAGPDGWQLGRKDDDETSGSD